MKFSALALGSALAAALVLGQPALASPTANPPADATSGADATASARSFGPLVTPADLNADPAPLVLDIRGAAYAQGHIPGAVDAPYKLFRGPTDNPGRVVGEDQIEATLQNLGVDEDRPVVVVHQGSDQDDFGAAARVYWTLKSAGLTDIAILNGGMNAWAAAGGPLDTAPVVPEPTLLDITWTDRWLADEADVVSISAGQQDALLLDARPPAFFEGTQAHSAAPVPGTVPGAQSLPHTEWFASGTTAIAPAATAADLAARLGLPRDREIVTFCNTGHWAATEWFALSELAGLPDVKLYPESMVGYAQGGHDLANTPSLVANLLRQIRGL